MPLILDKNSPAIGQTKEALKILINDKTIIRFRLVYKTRRDFSIKTLYFRVWFRNNRSAFELKVGKKEKTGLVLKKYNRMVLNINGIPDPETLSKMIRLEVPKMKRFVFEKSGIIVEDQFQKILTGMKQRNLIEDFDRTHTGGKDDRNGVDFFIKYQRKEIPLQIKSSAKRQQEHILCFPKIPSLVVARKRRRLLEDYSLYIFEQFSKNKIVHM